MNPNGSHPHKGKRPNVADPDELARDFAADAILGVGCSVAYSPSYVETLRADAERFLSWVESERGLSLPEVTQGTVRSYLAFLLSTRARNRPTQRSPNTVYGIFMRVRAFCRWAVQKGILPEDPTAGMKGPRRVYAFVEPLADGELAAVLDACARGRSPELAARNQALLLMLAFTGLRAGEILSTDRADLEGRETVKVVGKGGKERRVALHPRVRAALALYFSLRRGDVDQEAAFVTQDGLRMQHTALRALLHRVGMQLRMPGLGAHALRRTAFTNMARAGFSAFELRAIGGWNTFAAAWQYVRRGAEHSALAKHRAFDPLAPENGHNNGRLRETARVEAWETGRDDS